MAGFYTSNPYWGQGLNNLAAAMYPDPSTDVRMGLLGDHRRKLEAETLGLQIKNREQQWALDNLPAVLGAMIPQVEGATGDSSAAMAGLTRATVGAGDKASDLAGVLQTLMQLRLAQGTPDQRVQSLVAGGHSLGYRDAVTPEERDEIQKREIEGSNWRTKYRADSQLTGTKYGADRRLEGVTESARQRLKGTEFSAEQRREGVEAAAKTRAGASVEGAKVRANAMLEGAKARAGATVEAAKVRTSGSGSQPKITPKDYDEIRADVSQRVYDSVGMEAGDADIDEVMLEDIVNSVASHYQMTKNYPIALTRAWEDIMGGYPPEEFTSGGLLGMFEDTTLTRPSGAPGKPAAATEKPAATTSGGAAPEGMMPQQSPAQYLAEARESLRRGAPRQVIEERLRSVGVDPKLLGP